jgi:hypothetical protein
MPLGTTEQIVYDFIKSDPKRREYWESQIQEITRIYLMTCRWITVAFKLMGRDLDEELKTAQTVIETYQSQNWTHEKRRSAMMRGMMTMQATTNNQSLGEIFADDYLENKFLPKIKQQSKYQRVLIIIWGISLLLSFIITTCGVVYYIRNNQADFIDILKYGLLSVFFLTLLIGFIPGTLCQWSYKD